MSGAKYLAWDAPLGAYEQQAADLLAAHRAGLPEAMKLLHENLPRFLDDKVVWLPRPISDDEIRDTALTIDDARLALARCYSFLDWASLASHVNAVSEPTSPVREFERASEAVITGDVDTLRSMLSANPELVGARSTRVTCHDPAVHGATLVHYLGANGIEGYRQQSPSNAVEVARLLLAAGAEADALAGMYGGQCATLSMLVSSSPPKDAGVQVPLVQVLIDHGANPNGAGEGAWRNPLMTALVFGFLDAAKALEERGADANTIELAAGLGNLGDVTGMIRRTKRGSRNRALVLAVINGQVDVVNLLLAVGEDPNRFNPDGFHSHCTPLHQASVAGNLAMVKLLVEHGARTDVRDELWHGTPLGWAEHGGHEHVVAYLRSIGATES